MNLYRLTNQFLKLSQVLEPGTSEKDPVNDPAGIMDKPRAMGLAADWLDKIQNSGRPRRAGWKRRVAETVFSAIASLKSDPLNFAAAEMDMTATPREIIQWTVFDVEGHYSDLVPVDKVKQALALFV